MAKEKRRLWLLFPARLVKRPLVHELGREFDVVTDVRQATVTDEIGITCLELDGESEVINAAIIWLEEQGVKVEPVEINTIEG